MTRTNAASFAQLVTQAVMYRQIQLIVKALPVQVIGGEEVQLYNGHRTGAHYNFKMHWGK